RDRAAGEHAATASRLARMRSGRRGRFCQCGCRGSRHTVPPGPPVEGLASSARELKRPTLAGSSPRPLLIRSLELFRHAGLVKRIDEGRKWIYYELTDKGRKILHPEKVAITLALASAIVSAAIGAFALISSSGSVLSGPGYSNQTALPAMRDASPSIGANLIGPLLFLLAVIALACALVIQRVGIRRRERFFQQLGVA